MGYSGLIYAAIVAGWAALLVPRWIRRNEEVDRAREEDAARGVRVLDRSGRVFRSGHGTFTFSAPEPDRSESDELPGADDTDGPEAPAAPLPGVAAFSVAARRRRRVLLVLLIALAAVSGGAIAGMAPPVAVIAPTALLLAFLVLARRAAAGEARRRARLIRVVRRQAAAEKEAVAEPQAERRRVAVLDDVEPTEPTEPVDPDAWDPVPVPLPTYLTKAKAPPPAVRKIDLSGARAWTSGRLDPATPALPPQRPAPAAEIADHMVAEEAERRRAVGD